MASETRWEYLLRLVVFADEEAVKNRKKHRIAENIAVGDAMVWSENGWIDLGTTLDELGQWRWELVATHPQMGMTGGGQYSLPYYVRLIYVFKRPLIE